MFIFNLNAHRCRRKYSLYILYIIIISTMNDGGGYKKQPVMTIKYKLFVVICCEGHRHFRTFEMCRMSFYISMTNFLFTRSWSVRWADERHVRAATDVVDVDLALRDLSIIISEHAENTFPFDIVLVQWYT